MSLKSFHDSSVWCIACDIWVLFFNNKSHIQSQHVCHFCQRLDGRRLRPALNRYNRVDSYLRQQRQCVLRQAQFLATRLNDLSDCLHITQMIMSCDDSHIDQNRSPQGSPAIRNAPASSSIAASLHGIRPTPSPPI